MNSKLGIIHRSLSRKTFIISVVSLLFFITKSSFAQNNNETGVLIPVGLARIDITPQTPIRLTGYAARDNAETDKVLQPISARAIAIGSDEQHPTVWITVDLVGITWQITHDVSEYLNQQMGIDTAQFAISASHTHGGPEIGNLINILQFEKSDFSDSLLPLDQLIHIAQYTRQLTRKLQEVAMEALKNRKPSYISWGQGQALFAANRRTKGGPVDVALPILKITSPDGSLRGVFINYACHGTTLGGNVNAVHGDWITEAKTIIESRHPGITALIALGTAGDANPAPRGNMEDVKAHGKEIADNVDKLLTAQLQPLNAPPTASMTWIKLPLSPVPSMPELIKLSKENSVKGYEARLTIERELRGKPIPTYVDYPLQVWNFDNKMVMVNLAGEVVVDYSILLKDKYGAEHTWINAYTNDVPCYIPSRRILKEGGYEGESNMYWYDKPAPFDPAVQNTITNAVDKLMPAAFKKSRPEANREQLIQKSEDNSYELLSWFAGTKGDHIKYMPEWKAFGWFDTGDQAFWKVNIEKAGKYNVYLVYSVSDTEAGKNFILHAGKKRLKGKVGKTGSWFTYKTEKIGTVHLSKGIHPFVLESGSKREKGSMFDVREIKLIPVG